MASRRYCLHAWTPGGCIWDVELNVSNAGLLSFTVLDLSYVRLPQFKFRTEDTNGSYPEPDDFVREIRRGDVTETRSYAASAGLRFTQPGAPLRPPPQPTFHLVTASRCRGG